MPEGLESAARHLPWAIFLPLAAAALNALLGRRLPRSLVALIACGALALDFGWACEAWLALAKSPPGTAIASAGYDWLVAGPLLLTARLNVDAIAVVMWLIITGIGLLIHIYSARYQLDEPGYGRYFAWLNLFVAAMLLLVLADSLPLLFVGWEGVGLASWALIGFSFDDVAKAQAGRKAFVVNRIGDCGLLLAMFLLFAGAGTLNFVELAHALAKGSMHAAGLTGAAFLLILAATGKSAQLPLYLWLPDAMAGPTPVSALIHAATMVTAGIYLLARTGFVLATSQAALATVALLGATTALFAALAALGQRDLKKVLAYSTVSQLGYMFMSVGLGAAPLALFHVLTHASFKACLFLAAGAVIHAAGGEQDMGRLGQLGRIMPRVAWPAGICTLAIAGMPPLSGFVSKDAILVHAYAATQMAATPIGQVATLCYALGLVTAALTAVYMGRWFVWIFWSPTARLSPEAMAHVHDAPLGLAVPLWILSAMAVGLGVLNWPHTLGGVESFATFLAGDRVGTPLGGTMLLEAPTLGEGAHVGLIAASTLACVLGLAFVFWRYERGQAYDFSRPKTALGLCLASAFGYDRAAKDLIVEPFDFTARHLLRQFERRLSSSAMLLLGHFIRLSSWLTALFHNGQVQRYMALFAAALVLLLWAALVPQLAPNLGRALEALAAHDAL